ncbi:MAG: hypothetical protein SXA11_03220 [Cyanobacteriota bacterium]|nr:hypothetical protein [Cyanobacteriota bacterium]
MATYEIHEFSTGIKAEISSDGSWRSRGYKVGEYMNSTLSQIPYVVERAIANNMFAVSKDRHSQNPTFVGREIRGNNGEPDWSVVAVVTPGGDEYARFNSFYRYFLCQGADRLWVILDAIDDYCRQYGRVPIFNPSEIKEIGKPKRHTVNKKPSVKLSFTKEKPFILKPGELSKLQIINAMAEKIANGKPVSWAYDVEAVEQVGQFLVIQAADDRAYQLLGNASTNNPRAMLPPGVDEARIKTAIKGLMGGSPIRQEWIQVLLQSDRVTPENWKTIFDDLGATTGIKQKNSNPQTVRLLTLRAILVPETLPEYLEWFGIDGKASKKEDDRQKISLEFQGKLKNDISQLEPLIDETMKSVLEQILTKKISIPAFSWLLTAPKSLWSSYKQPLIENIKSDLKSIGKSLGNPESSSLIYGDSVWQNLSSSWERRNTKANKYYQPFADLFEKLGDYELASYFYQVSKGVVPKNVFREAFGNKDEHDIWGLTLKREITWDERLISWLTRYSLYLAIIILLVLTHSYSYVLGLSKGEDKKNSEQVVQRSSNGKTLQQARQEGYEEGKNDGYEEGFQAAQSIPNSDVMTRSEMVIALEKFETTVAVMEELVARLTDRLMQKFPQAERQTIRNGVINEVKTIIRKPNLNYSSAIQGNENDKKQLIDAIYLYQKDTGERGYGYIDDNFETDERIEEKVKDALLFNFAKRTKQALENLIKELLEDKTLKDKNVYRTQIIDAIKKTLVGIDDYTNVMEKGNPQDVEKFVNSIRQYQGGGDGIIDYNQKTYRRLKEDVKKQVLKELLPVQENF